MLVDVALLTAGLYGAGGLAAAQYIAVYMVVPVYAAFVFSSRASAVATMFATVSYLTIVVLQTAGLLGFTHPPAGDAAVVAAFNLLVLNIVGWLAALLAEAYRAGRHRLTALNVELERAHDESLRMNSQIQRAARRYVLGEVVAGVTHEVRNALQGAFGHLWLASRKPGMPPEALEHLKQVEGACEDAMRILRNTLDLAPRPEPDRQPVVLAEVARHVAEVKSFDLRRDGITLRVDVPETLPLVRGAAFQLEQVVLNLVVNAQDELRGRPGRREIAILGTAEPAMPCSRCTTAAAVSRRWHWPPVRAVLHDQAGWRWTGLAISAGMVEAFWASRPGDRRRAGAIFRLELPAAAAGGQRDHRFLGVRARRRHNDGRGVAARRSGPPAGNAHRARLRILGVLEPTRLASRRGHVAIVAAVSRISSPHAPHEHRRPVRSAPAATPLALFRAIDEATVLMAAGTARTAPQPARRRRRRRRSRSRARAQRANTEKDLERRVTILTRAVAGLTRSVQTALDDDALLEARPRRVQLWQTWERIALARAAAAMPVERRDPGRGKPRPS